MSDEAKIFAAVMLGALAMGWLVSYQERLVCEEQHRKIARADSTDAALGLPPDTMTMHLWRQVCLVRQKPAF